MRWWMLAALAWVIPAQPPKPEPRFFRYQKSIEVAKTHHATSAPGDPTASDAARQTCVPLDAELLEDASPGLSDLRVYRDHQEVPYVVRVSTEPPVEAPSRATLLNRGERDGAVVFDVRVMRTSYQTVEIETRARHFIASVAVWGSHTVNDSHGTRLGTFTIFDLTDQQLSRSTVVHLPRSTFPYLHFAVTGPLEASDIIGVTVLAPAPRPAVYSTVAETKRIVRRGAHSVATLLVPARVPVERVEVTPAPAAGNFSRAVAAEFVHTGQSGEAERFGGTIARVHVVQDDRRIDLEQNTFDIPGGPPQSDTGNVEWTVAIDNGDDTPLPIDVVRLEMRERRLCFDAVPGGQYMLYYGDSALVQPRYDYATLFHEASRPQSAILGPEQPNAAFVPRPDTRPLTERYPALFWSALILVVAALAIVAYRTNVRGREPKEG